MSDTQVLYILRIWKTNLLEVLYSLSPFLQKFAQLLGKQVISLG